MKVINDTCIDFTDADIDSLPKFKTTGGLSTFYRLGPEFGDKKLLKLYDNQTHPFHEMIIDSLVTEPEIKGANKPLKKALVSGICRGVIVNEIEDAKTIAEIALSGDTDLLTYCFDESQKTIISLATRGYIMWDVSRYNILLGKDNEVTLVDLDGGCRLTTSPIHQIKSQYSVEEILKRHEILRDEMLQAATSIKKPNAK